MPSSSENARSWPASPPAPHVLLVDDESVIRSAMSRYFARQGWIVREAPDGDAARCILGDEGGEEFDLVICDLRMPRTSGEDLYRWLREQRPELAARFAFSSGDTLAPEAAAFLEEAGRPVLPKPFDLGDLARVAELVRADAHA